METLIFWVVCGVAGGMIYQSKKRPFVKGFLWGLLLGLVGVIVTLCKSKINVTEEGRVENENIKNYGKTSKINMKVYISGKITGLPFEEVEDNFYHAQNRLEEEGFEVVNPLENGLPQEAEWHEHMKADIRLLLECDTIYLLENWKESKGARIERDIAVALGYDVVEQIK